MNRWWNERQLVTQNIHKNNRSYHNWNNIRFHTHLTKKVCTKSKWSVKKQITALDTLHVQSFARPRDYQISTAHNNIGTCLYPYRSVSKYYPPKHCSYYRNIQS